MGEASSPFEDVYVSIPRGGPIYVSDMVGPLTSVSEFQSSVQDELKDLRKELCMDFIEQHGDEISVDELKILSEEELFQASLEGGKLTGDPSPSSEECSYRTTNESNIDDVNLPCSVNSGVDEDYVPSADFPRRSKRTTDSGKMNGRVSKKSKRVTKKDTKHEEDYMAEVEKLAKIKQKQEEDKLAARLHSFSGACGPISCVSASEKKERMSSFNYTSCLTQVKSSNTREHIPLHGSETLLCIEVYHNRRGTRNKTQEILVLGQQLLTELRDKIYCPTDQIMKLATKDDPSGYFLIEDIFYNDSRDACATDYSKPIIEWLRDSKDTALEKWECIISGELQQKHKEFIGSGSGPKLPQLKARPMQATRFCDLNFRLGAGYLYCHQGDCKHVMVIRDMRLIHPEDVQNRASYPLIMFQSRLRFQKCSCCKIFRATKVTMHDKWAPENPCYFCGICYFMLHYSDEKLIYDDFQNSSKPILEWLRESKDTALEKWECIISGELQQKHKEFIGSGPKLPQLKARPMQATHFCDLNFRLGAGYLYCHQGDCKHVMVIRDMRLIHPEDVQNRASYPLIMFQSRLRFQKCSCCKIFRATKVTMHDKWAPENPCYFCGICYFMLHYSDEKLIYDDFQVFDYIHD